MKRAKEALDLEPAGSTEDKLTPIAEDIKDLTFVWNELATTWKVSCCVCCYVLV